MFGIEPKIGGLAIGPKSYITTLKFEVVRRFPLTRFLEKFCDTLFTFLNTSDMFWSRFLEFEIYVFIGVFWCITLWQTSCLRERIVVSSSSISVSPSRQYQSRQPILHYSPTSPTPFGSTITTITTNNTITTITTITIITNITTKFHNHQHPLSR